MSMQVGELFILGFFGKSIPPWLREFAARFGLGGVILFDYSVRTRQYDNNIESPAQVRELCAQIAALPSAPMVFIDQEGGLVRRLKEARGFSPLPSAKDFNRLVAAEKRSILTASFNELRALLKSGRIVGPMVHDARVAALCLQHGVRELWSADRDFGRFPALTVTNPLAG